MIIFNNTLTGVIPAYNNNIIEFKSDSLIESLQAKITINNIEFIIYKLPSGWFRFNLKEVAKQLVNKFNFEDKVNPDLLLNYTYQNLDGWFVGNVNFQITLIDATIETTNFSITFLASCLNLEDYKKTNPTNNETFLLLPFIKNTINKYYAKYWEGYPFDIAFFDSTGDDIYLKNNGLIVNFGRESLVNRLFFSDGLTDTNINTYFPFSVGKNNIELRNINASLNQFLEIDYTQLCGDDAIYLKWFNAQGGYSYWLFNKYYQRALNFKSIGELENDFNNLQNTISPLVQIGRTSKDRVRVDSDLLNENEFNLLVGVLSSPKVYLYTGKALARASANDWIEVEVKSSSVNLREWKNQPKNIAFDFELPQRNYQSI